MITLILLIAVTFSITYYNKKTKTTYQKIAWETLDKNSKDKIIGIMEKSKVTKDTIDGKTRVYVSFHAVDEAMLGPITVIINPGTKKPEGIVSRK